MVGKHSNVSYHSTMQFEPKMEEIISDLNNRFINETFLSEFLHCVKFSAFEVDAPSKQTLLFLFWDICM